MLPAAPWRFGYWNHEHAPGVDLQWKGKHLFLQRKDEPWVASIDLAPPWLALHGDAGIVAILIDELFETNEVYVDGEKIVTRAKKVDRPRPPKKLVDWFDLLAEHGLLPKMEEAERDQLLFSKLEHATSPKNDTLGRILEDRSPLVISHDSHWFGKNDGIIARFAAPLEGETIRFTEEHVNTGSVTIGVSTPTGKDSFQCEAFIWDVAESLDAKLREHGANKRIYTLSPYQEDMHLYIVLSPQQRKRLIAAGIGGIQKDARPHHV